MSSEPLQRRTWIYIIGGFLQTQGKPNGSIRLFDDLDCKFSRPGEVRVEFNRWSDNWSDVAEHVWRLRPDGYSDRIRVVICGYSWGGYSATLLAREFAKRGVSVHSLVLSDAVYRHWYPLGWWRAFAPWRRIKVPENVRYVHWFRQDLNFPRGHDIVAENPSRTRVSAPIKANQFHSYMDDLLYWHNQAHESVAKCLKEPTA